MNQSNQTQTQSEPNQRRVLGSIVYWKEYTQNMTNQLILREKERETKRIQFRQQLDVMVSIPMALALTANDNDETIALTTNNNERDF